MKLVQYIKSDLYRFDGKTGLSDFLKRFVFSHSFNYLVWLRISQFGGILKFISIPIILLKMRGNIQISYKTKIGYGLYIAHNGPIVINSTTIIGSNVNLSQFITIGSNESQAAIVGDEVYIGPNVCVVENVRIGDGATIGAGSVVTKNIPPHATAAGNYAGSQLS
ncbi:MAG: serine acetyltransferase [Lentilactobacillus hilgardii]|uniref:serine acetyltransferase n=1 Tax=Lactobacillaceae TaxID=33958 RepID=UPI0010B4B59F|nr:hypothetical protein OAL24_01668 [Oenococcus sicerae]